MPEQQEQNQNQGRHPIEGLMKTAMESIKEMVDVNTVVGVPVETPDGMVIIPVSKVTCGFAAGGGEYEQAEQQKKIGEEKMPSFGGGSGAGVSVHPVGFLVVGNGQIRLMPVDSNVVAERLIDLAPQLLSKIELFLQKNNQPPGKQASPANPEGVILS